MSPPPLATSSAIKSITPVYRVEFADGRVEYHPADEPWAQSQPALKLAGAEPWAALLETYLANRRQDGIGREHLRDNERHIRAIAERFGWLMPAEADEDSVRIYLGELTGRGGKAPSASYYNNVRSYLSNWFNWLRKRGHIERNPTDEIPELRRPKGRTRGLSPDQISHLIARTREKGKRGELRADIYLAAAWTGMRRDELTSLTVGDCHLGADPKIEIRDSKGAKLSGTGEVEYVPLVAQEAIECLRRRCSGRESGDRVFASMPSPATVRIDMERAGIVEDGRGRTATLRSLRNSLATMLAAANVPPKAAQAVLRHRDIRLTLETYVDATLIPAREAMGLLATTVTLGGAAAAEGEGP